MVEIRDTRQGSKRRELWLDGALLRALPIDVLRASGITEGQAASPNALHHSIEAVEPECARERALRLIGYRERSVREMRDRLADDGYQAHVVGSLIERFVAVGLLDDARFAEVYVRTKLSAGWGSHRIASELARAGVDETVVLDVMAGLAPPGAELERAVATISRLPLDTASARQKALRKLVARGFDYPLARDAIAAASERPSPDLGVGRDS